MGERVKEKKEEKTIYKFTKESIQDRCTNFDTLDSLSPLSPLSSLLSLLSLVSSLFSLLSSLSLFLSLAYLSVLTSSFSCFNIISAFSHIQRLPSFRMTSVFSPVVNSRPSFSLRTLLHPRLQEEMMVERWSTCYPQKPCRLLHLSLILMDLKM